MGRTFLDIDMARAADLLGMDRRQAEMFRDLQRGHFVALGPALSRRPLPVVIGTVETGARSTSPKLLPLPQAGEDTHELIFARDPAEEERAVRRPPPPRPVPVATADLLARLVRTPSPAAPTRTAEPEMDEAERDLAFDAVLRELLEDPEAAFRTVAVLYQDFLVRCRIRRVPGEALPLPAFRRRLAVVRAGIDAADAGSETWHQAMALADTLAEDVHGVFLLLARSSIEGVPCPPDATIARVYGTHSTGRARRLLAYFEERGLVVVRADTRGWRIVAFPDLGTETGPGDPAAPDDLPSRKAAE
jgi:hypothetical protein